MIPLLLLACDGPQMSEAFHQVSVTPTNSAADIETAFVDSIAAATFDVGLMVPGLESAAVAEALIAAADRGVSVEVVTDIDSTGQSGLIALEEAGLVVQYADDSVTYFDFAINADVSWSSEQVVMSNTVLVVDEVEVLSASYLGEGEGTRLLWRGRGEDIGGDFAAEHNQIFGGTDASARTAFDSLAKSVTDARWSYPTQTDLSLELWFGPQERLIKRMIDNSYNARGSIWLMTDDLADEGMINALYAKAVDGFDVRVLVGPSFGVSSPNSSAILTRETTGMQKRQLSDAVVPTLMLVDLKRDRTGRYNTARGMMLSHPVWSANRLFAGAEVLTDQLVDGNLWVLNDFGAPSTELTDLEAAFEAAWEAGVEL
ncbi:MAG: hypothetical protein ACI8RZ_005068 [Myxococcota bacterium]|jgi:hypothetical protein